MTIVEFMCDQLPESEITRIPDSLFRYAFLILTPFALVYLESETAWGAHKLFTSYMRFYQLEIKCMRWGSYDFRQ